MGMWELERSNLSRKKNISEEDRVLKYTTCCIIYGEMCVSNISAEMKAYIFSVLVFPFTVRLYGTR